MLAIVSIVPEVWCSHKEQLPNLVRKVRAVSGVAPVVHAISHNIANLCDLAGLRG